MNIDSIKNGIVIDHITAGKGMEVYRLLELKNLDCMVALITNASSAKMGRKDIIKIDELIALDLDLLGYVDRGITVSIIKNGEQVEKMHVTLPKKLKNVLKCKNPRCITTSEAALPSEFLLTDEKRGSYCCAYCETEYHR